MQVRPFGQSSCCLIAMLCPPEGTGGVGPVPDSVSLLPFPPAALARCLGMLGATDKNVTLVAHHP